MAGSRLSSLCFADGEAPPAAAPNFGIVVVVFLRGGMDGLNLVAPVDDPNYIAARPAPLRVLPDGDNAGLQLGNAPKGFDFRLHPNAKPLKEIYDAGHLAIVHASGLTSGTRSHFEAMDQMERGVVDGPDINRASGWLARHLDISGGGGLIPAFAAMEAAPVSLLGAPSAIAAPDLGNFAFYGDDNQLAAVQSLYEGAGLIQRAGARALAAMKAVREKLPRNEKGEIPPYQPLDGVAYPGQGEFGHPLQNVARLIKMDVGLTAATVDFGGWDTHQNQAGPFGALVDQLASGLGAFYGDLGAYHDRLTVLVMSDFGRRLKSNQSQGTDHGHGNAILALGGSVNGGRIFGRWPGLASEQLDSGADLAITTDYRQIVAELLVRRFGDAKLSTVFPGLKQYQPLGLFKGADVKTDVG